MRTILINGKEYKFEFRFEAAMDQDFVSKCFKLESGAYLVGDRVEGMSVLVGTIPELCAVAFHAGLLENDNSIDKSTANELMKIYMKDHNLNFYTLWTELHEDMKGDGFFELTGINSMVKELIAGAEQAIKELEKMEKKSKKTSTTEK